MLWTQSGATNGHSSNVVIIPSLSLGIVTLSNSPVFLFDLIDQILPLIKYEADQLLAQRLPEAEKLTGRYFSTDSELELIIQNNKVLIQSTIKEPFFLPIELIPTHQEGCYTIYNGMHHQEKITFIRNENNIWEKLTYGNKEYFKVF